MAQPAALRRYWASRRGKKTASRRGRSRVMRSRSRGKKQFTLPLAVVAGFASPVARTWNHYQTSGVTGPEGAIAEFSRTMIGVNPYSTQMGFEAWRLRYGLVPVAIGLLVHKGAGWLGINRMLAQAGIPVVRI